MPLSVLGGGGRGAPLMPVGSHAEGGAPTTAFTSASYALQGCRSPPPHHTTKIEVQVCRTLKATWKKIKKYVNCCRIFLLDRCKSLNKYLTLIIIDIVSRVLFNICFVFWIEAVCWDGNERVPCGKSLFQWKH